MPASRAPHIALAVLLAVVPLPAAHAGSFVRGDSNASGSVDISDASFILGFLFRGSPPTLDCEDAADTDDSGALEITDGIFLLNFLFRGGGVPAAPFVACGVDPTSDALGCGRFPRCPQDETPRHLNPITGAPLDAEDLARVELLRGRFPGNLLVPPATSDGALEGERLRRRVADLAANITRGTATAACVEEYFTTKEKLLEDRLELATFVVGEPQWPDVVRDRYRRVLAGTRRLLAALPLRHEKSLRLLELDGERKTFPDPLASITPRSREVVRGEEASFQAGILVNPRVSLSWGLPDGGQVTGREVAFSTRGLEAGVYTVSLVASATGGERTVDTALLTVVELEPIGVDLAVRAVDVVPIGIDNGDQPAPVQIYAAIANLGTLPAVGVTVDFLIDGDVVHHEAAGALGPGDGGLFPSPELAPADVYGHSLLVSVGLRTVGLDENPDNDDLSKVVPAPVELPDLEPASVAVPQGPQIDVPGFQFQLPADLLADIASEVRPLPFDLGPVDGIADLHLHQLSDVGFDGRHVWGAHDGPSEAAALPECNGVNHAVCWLPGWVIEATGSHSWEAGQHSGLFSSVASPLSILPCDPPFVTGGFGAFVKGFHPNVEAKAFKHWPNWQTVTHQQVFSQWLEDAHDDGLNLVVMSAVSARHLCIMTPPAHGFAGGHPLDDVVPPGISNIGLDRAIATAPACNDMRNVRRQLLAAWQFDRDHPWYKIALTPGHARQIIHEGRMAVVLHIECSEIFDEPETEEELFEYVDYFVDDLGVRSFQAVHEFNNSLAGPCFFKPFFEVLALVENVLQAAPGVVNPLGDLLSDGDLDFLRDLEEAKGIVRDPPRTGDNSLGLTDLGRAVMHEMMNRGLLVDIAHMSRRAANDTYDIAKEHGYYPLYVSHARYKDLLTGNPDKDHLARHWETLQHVKETGGMLGLRTGEEHLRTYTPSGVANNCPGSIRSFAQAYALGAIGYGIPQAFGTDLNGYIQQMRPRFHDKRHPKYDDPKWACNVDHPGPSTRDARQEAQGDRETEGTNTDFDLTGFGHIGQLGAVMADLSDNLGVDTVDLERSAETFLAMWERSLRMSTEPDATPPNDRCLDRSRIVGGPAIDPALLAPGCTGGAPGTTGCE